ncbi:hypothetical protein BaRGS_00017825 [Batillaria attramentaria]|uniref:Uncharacterized protein n=1 Tax=Batillaria attramentaria TaxID=370345 RepID=A0ABD0KVJ7_9CAEN
MTYKTNGACDVNAADRCDANDECDVISEDDGDRITDVDCHVNDYDDCDVNSVWSSVLADNASISPTTGHGEEYHMEPIITAAG